MNSITSNAAFRVSNIGGGASNSVLSRQWFARPADQRFLTLDDLAASVGARRQRSIEARSNSRDLALRGAAEIRTREDMHDLFISTADGDRAMTHWSFGQLAGLAKAPAGYLRTLPAPMVADNLNYGLRFARDAEAVKLYYDDADLLAATGPDYGRIFDEDVVRAVQNVVGNGAETRWKVPGRLDWSTMIYDPLHPVSIESTTLYASDRDVFLFLVDDLNPIQIGVAPNGDPDYVFRGFYVSNSEFGSRRFVIAGFYLRGLCENRIMWGVEGFQEVSMRHSKYAPARFVEEIRPALASFANGSETRLREAVAQAKAAKVASDDDEAVAFLRAREFSKARALDVLAAVEREEGRPARSVWDFAQGITAVARAERNTDTRLDLELTAGKLLDKVA